MPELIIKHQMIDGLSWPAEAAWGSQNLYFSESVSSAESQRRIIFSKMNKFWEGFFKKSSLVGVWAILLHIAAPAGNLWLNIFLVSLFLNWIIWIKRLDLNKEKEILDVAEFFDYKLLQTFRRAIINSGSKQVDGMHLILELLKDQEIKKKFRFGPSNRHLLFSNLNLYLSQLPEKPPALTRDLAEIPFLAYKLSRDFNEKIITPLTLLKSLLLLPQDSRARQAVQNLNINLRDSNSIHSSVSTDLSDDKFDLIFRSIGNTIGPRRNPISLLFVGNSDFEKKNLARRIADEHFQNPDSYLEFDLDSATIQNLFGDNFRQGLLALHFTDRPAAVIYLENFHQATLDIQSVWFQIFENGTWPGPQKVLDFSNSIIIVSISEPKEFAHQFHERFQF